MPLCAESFSIFSFCLIECFVIFFIVIYFKVSLFDEVHFFYIAFVSNYSHIVHIKSTEHINNKIIRESSFAFIKEVTKCLLKIFESSGALDKFSLHFWCDLLIELKFFYDEIKVIHKGIFNVFSNVIVKIWLNVDFTVRLLQLFNPDIKRVEFFLN